MGGFSVYTKTVISTEHPGKLLENYTKNNESLQRTVITADRTMVCGQKDLSLETHLNSNSATYAVEVSFTTISRQMSARDGEAEAGTVRDGNQARMLMANLQSQVLSDPSAAIEAQSNTTPAAVLRLLS
jgi:hypothetical protein